MARPPKKIYKSKRRNYRKKRSQKKYKRSIIPTAPKNFNVVKLHYTENILLTPGAIPAAYVWKINDVYDPNLSGTGHQPYFRDQMYAIYSKCRVLWAKITCTFITDSALTPVFLVLGPNQSGSADVVLDTASERKGSKELYLNGSTIRKLSCSSTPDYYMGAKKGTALLNPEYAQDSSTPLPVPQCMYYQILAKSLTGNTQNVYVKVDLVQIARFEEPLQQSGS